MEEPDVDVDCTAVRRAQRRAVDAEHPVSEPSGFLNGTPLVDVRLRVSRRGFPYPSTTTTKPPCASRALCTRVTRSLGARDPRMRGAVGVCNARGLLVAASAARGVGGPWRGWSMSVSFTLRTREVTDKHRACPHRPRVPILIDQSQSGSLSSNHGAWRAILVRATTRHCVDHFESDTSSSPLRNR